MLDKIIFAAIRFPIENNVAMERANWLAREL